MGEAWLDSPSSASKLYLVKWNTLNVSFFSSVYEMYSLYIKKLD